MAEEAIQKRARGVGEKRVSGKCWFGWIASGVTIGSNAATDSRGYRASLAGVNVTFGGCCGP